MDCAKRIIGLCPENDLKVVRMPRSVRAEIDKDLSISMSVPQLKESIRRLHRGYHLGGKPQTREQTNAR